MEATEHLKTHCRMALLHHAQAIRPTWPISWTGQQDSGAETQSSKHRGKLTAFQNKKLGVDPEEVAQGTAQRSIVVCCESRRQIRLNHAEIVVRPS